ncbi:MAG: enoyl-CoA hydratase/isomerase family protein [Halobacteria archaeon]
MAQVAQTAPVLIYDKAGQVVTITLNRPDKMNALNRALWKGLGEALAKANADPEARVVILTGAGKAFSAGNDLADFGGISEGGKVIDALFAMEKPVIAAVRGPCMAGAFEITILCDFVIAASDARLSAREARIGLNPVWTLTHLVHAIGERAARDIALTGRDLSAEEAFRVGLVWKVVPPEKLMDEARGLAALLMEAAPLPQREIKKYLAKKHGRDEAKPLMETFARLMASEDFKEAIRAFAEKRKPVWKGK